MMDERFRRLWSLAMLFLPAPAFAQDAFPTGIWTDSHTRIVVRIVPCDASSTTYCGIVVRDNRRGWTAIPSGHVIIRNLSQGTRNWSGHAYDGRARFSFTLQPITNERASARLCITHVFCMTERLHQLSDFAAQ